MKITNIVRQAKQADRYSLFVDGKYAFSLSEGALLQSGLVRGQELTAEELKQWKHTSAEDRVYGNTIRYAMRRPHSVWEVENYLRRKQASPALITKILNKLSELQLLDDASFAQSWIVNRQLLRPTSRRKLQQELRAKHVGEEVVNEALMQQSKEEETQALHLLIARKRQSVTYRQAPLKLMSYLARQGFDYGDIKAALERISEDES